MKFLLVDDHALFRDGLKHVLTKFETSVEIVEVSNCNDAFRVVREQNDLDLVLLDLELPDMSGLDGLEKIIEINPIIPVAIISGSEEAAKIQRALKMGAMGYIPKSLSSDIMLQALQLILKGGKYIPDNILTGIGEAEPRAPKSLTVRQSEILQLMIRGKSNKEIAQELRIADNTVRVHISAIFQILGVNNRTEAAFAAAEQGYAE